MADPISPVRWGGDHLELLDQRRLPGRAIFARIPDAAGVTDAIRDMVVRGAPAIGLAAAYGVVLAALEADRRGLARDAWMAAVADAAASLCAARPTAVNLGWAVQRMLGAAAAGGGSEELLSEAGHILQEDVESNRSLAGHGAALLPDGARVLTHCNAGALATGGYGTALGIIRLAHAQGRLAMVYATETRPLLQGARLTAWELTRDGIPVTLLADGAAPWLIHRGAVDAVVVGADRVAANGDTANKIGTFALAGAAKAHRIPFYVACATSTLDRGTASGDAIVIEERSAAEITHLRGHRLAPRRVRVWNPAFDITPARMVSALVTEAGVLRAPYEAAIDAALERRSRCAASPMRSDTDPPAPGTEAAQAGVAAQGPPGEHGFRSQGGPGHVGHQRHQG
ncbi:MAG: S-methyl-5-thioribose-1-phosphate isomerase [Bacillota bacterium]|nr:S-methyl-5-thioribose-1-phosphate isomerase [Bacillota bacterium]